MPGSERLAKNGVLTQNRMDLSRFEFPLLLGAFVVVALAFSVIVPLGEAPDEVPHYAYVQYLAEHHRLPAHTGAVLGESHQPPLYYAIGALATFWIPQGDFQAIANPDFTLADPQAPNLLLHTRREAFPYSGWPLAWHIVRVMSVAMGAVTVWAAWQLARQVLPANRSIALGTAAFVAFLPEFIVVRAAVNNDNLNVMLVSLAVLQSVRMVRRPLGGWDAALLGMALGLAALAKLNGLVVWFFAGAIYLYRARASRDWKGTAVSAALCFGIAFAILVPWMLYEQIVYGDPLGWSVILSTTPTRQSSLTFADAVFYLRGLYTGFWGRFGGMTQIEMSSALYAGLGALTLVSLAGWLLYLRDALSHKLESGVRSTFVLALTLWLPMLVAHLRFSLAILGTDQGRQLFIGLPLLGLLLVVGLGRFLGAFAAIVWGGGLFALSLGVMIYLNAIYAPPVLNSSVTVGKLDNPVDFGETIRVIDYRIDRTRVAPGGSIDVELHWQALGDPKENYWLLLQLVGRGETVVNKEGVPSAGRLTTDWWRTGQTFVSRHSLQVPADGTTGKYALQIGLHPFGRWEWLPVRGQDMFTLDTIQVTASP
jgi:hypothetical protein